MATGMHRVTGTNLSGLALLEQSIRDVLTTRLGTRIERRNYGISDWVDQVMSDADRVRLQGQVITALLHWIPELKLRRVQVVHRTSENMAILIDGSTRELGDVQIRV